MMVKSYAEEAKLTLSPNKQTVSKLKIYYHTTFRNIGIYRGTDTHYLLSQRLGICIKKPELHEKTGKGPKKLMVEKKATEKQLKMSILR